MIETPKTDKEIKEGIVELLSGKKVKEACKLLSDLECEIKDTIIERAEINVISKL